MASQHKRSYREQIYEASVAEPTLRVIARLRLALDKWDGATNYEAADRVDEINAYLDVLQEREEAAKERVVI